MAVHFMPTGNYRAYRRLATLARPLFSAPYPGRWRLFDFVNNPKYQNCWRGAELRWTKSKVIGMEIPCDLATFSGRIAWFFRRWYELETQSAILSLLPRGGTFVDIGANVGMASLAAARAVGAEGRIVAFEPNPAIAAIFAEGIKRNRLSNVTLHNCAIGTQAREFDLFVPDSNHGEGSLATDFGDRPGKMVKVTVGTGEPIAALDRIDLIKIDVEGFELEVVSAIAPALLDHRPLILCEIMDAHLARAGTSSARLIAKMAELGYVARAVDIAGDGLFRQRAVLTNLKPSAESLTTNALFVPEGRAAELDAVEFLALPK